MATKKQKREAGQAKREAFEAEMRESGLRALRAEQEKREREHLQVWEKRHEKHFKFDDECPHCDVIKKGLRAKAATSAISKMPRPTQRKSPAPKLENTPKAGGDVHNPFAVVAAKEEIPDGSSLEMECI